MADCCNTTKNDFILAPSIFEASVHPFSAKGGLMMCSSKKGEPSTGDPDYGGVFLQAFFNSFDGHWQSSFERAKKEIEPEQHPRAMESNFYQPIPEILPNSDDWQRGW